MCAAISENGTHTHIPSLGPYNTQKLLMFLEHLNFYPWKWERCRRASPTKNCHYMGQCSLLSWFTTHPRIVMVFLPPYSPFLNPISPLGDGECMSISLKIRGACSIVNLGPFKKKAISGKKDWDKTKRWTWGIFHQVCW